MIRFSASALGMCVLVALSLPGTSTQEAVIRTASSFLSPGTRFSTLVRSDSHTGSTIASQPAVLAGHLLSPDSDDIVFASANESKDKNASTLFLTTLHKFPNGYAIIFQKSYYQRFLWGQDFRTVGLRLVRLPDDSTDSILVITARGASLGAQVELYRWQRGVGMTNIMPDHPMAHRVSIVEGKGQFILKLAFQQYAGQKGIPEPIVYRWDGRQMIRAG